MASADLPVSRREIFAWAMYDFANSGFTTVVLTAIFGAYFVSVVAGSGRDYDGAATLLWTVATGLANVAILLTAPLLGAMADSSATKKRFLLFATALCVTFTFALGFVGPGDVVLGMVCVAIATFGFASCENLIAAFLPELAKPAEMGRISGYGWSLGYFGGMLVLGLCLVYITWARSRGFSASHYVGVSMFITSVSFALAALPTFFWLNERARAVPLPRGQGYWRVGIERLRTTFSHARRHQDLFRFLLSLSLYYCGIYTVVVLAAVYAEQVMGFSTSESIVMILVVNLTAAVGALGFGFVQDRMGSVRTLAVTLVIWIVALVYAYAADSRFDFWIVANLVGIAMGASQSAGRALVGLFAPVARTAEFFGLWGVFGKLAALVGPLSYGLVAYGTQGNHRLALLSTATFFILGLLVLLTVDEARGRRAALSANNQK
jgi:UMF1 family MFS transporter